MPERMCVCERVCVRAGIRVVTNVQTTNMKCNDMHKSDAVTFSWPEIEDLAWYDEQDSITTVPEPTTVGDTTRMADTLSFEFDFAACCFS